MDLKITVNKNKTLSYSKKNHCTYYYCNFYKITVKNFVSYFFVQVQEEFSRGFRRLRSYENGRIRKFGGIEVFGDDVIIGRTLIWVEKMS